MPDRPDLKPNLIKLPPLAYAMSARFFITYGVQIQSVLSGWQMYSLTHDTLKLGLIGLAEAFPAITTALFAGHIVDRSPPVRIYRVLIFLATASLFVSLYGHSEEMLYLAAILTGFARAFAAPSMNTIIPKVVPRDLLPKASAWMTMVNRLALVLGPASAGLFYAYAGYNFAYGIAIAAAAVSFLSTFFLPHIPAPEQKIKENLRESFTVALKYVFNHKLLLATLSLDMFAVLFGGVTAILPAIATDVLHTDSAGLGFLRAAPAFGAIIVTLALTKISIEKKAGRSLLLCVIGFGICMIAFAASRNFYLSCAILLLSGMFDSVSMVVRGTIMQLSSPNEMRGRIAAVNSMFIVSSNEIGAFESGVAASALGLIPSIYFGGAMTLITVAVIYRLYPKLADVNLKEL